MEMHDGDVTTNSFWYQS